MYFLSFIYNVGLDIERQLLFSAIDQFAFGDEIGEINTNTSSKEVFQRALNGSFMLQEKFTSFGSKFESNRSYTLGDMSSKLHMPLLSHTHFVNYGGKEGDFSCSYFHFYLFMIYYIYLFIHLFWNAGGYYSYLFAKMYAAQIWTKRFQANPLSR